MIIKTEEIPEEIEYNTVFEITSNNISSFTHGFFKYPCKFIPQIPRWAIRKYTNKGDIVLDPFAGSGTTLVEAILIERNGLAVDFDKLSQLLCRAKTTTLSKKQIIELKDYKKHLFKKTNNLTNFLPDIHNLNHWFSKNNIDELLTLKQNIEEFYRNTGDEKLYNFLLICFVSIIRKGSYADDTSPKPYVSKRIKKTPQNVKYAFYKAFDSYLKKMNEYTNRDIGTCGILSDDARNIHAPKYDGKITLAVTSPPYINAFDYVRILRLENAWLGYYGDANIVEIKKKQVGTETISSKIYNPPIDKTGIEKLDRVILDVSKTDKKRAFVIWKFFEDMSKNFNEIHRLLKRNGHYVIAIGNSKIRGIDVRTHELLIELAQKNGYRLHNLFSYIIKNKYLRIPRSGRGGHIDNDWIIDLIKV